MPLPGTRVIPIDWSEHHRPTAELTMTSECEITRRSGSGTTGTDGTWMPPATTVIYSGICRVVRESSEELNPIQGERRLTTRQYDVQIKVDAGVILIGDVLTITSGNAQVLGKSFRVESVDVASEEWSQDLIVTEFEEG